VKTRQIAIDILRGNGVKVDLGAKHILLGRSGPGLKLWQWIDCLCNYYNFMWIREKN
jgi:hypothetical protein